MYLTEAVDDCTGHPCLPKFGQVYEEIRRRVYCLRLLLVMLLCPFCQCSDSTV